MEKMDINFVEKNGLLAYKYLRGSHSYHLNVETSDVDYGGVWICPPEMLLGLRSNYVEQVADEKNDVVYYEFGRWIELLLKSNPTALESLYVPKDCIVGDVHPAIQLILDNRDAFLSKECFNSFFGYANSQIVKARGLNKKIVNPITERKDILDFCYTFYNQGSQPIKDFLKEHNLDQRYCGLVSIPNMKDVYGVYYDFAAYFKFEEVSEEEMCQMGPFVCEVYNAPDYVVENELNGRIECKQFYKYGGIVDPDDNTKSNEVRLSSIPKGEKPICFMTYNKDAYTYHCKMYREYKEWEKNRNPIRYESNLNKNYDAKNVMHCMRLIRMAKELAQGKGFNLVRDNDRDYLLDIRNHKFEYEEIMAQLENEKREMEEAIKTTTLPDKVDMNFVNDLLIKSRKTIYEF